jgi:hypothetical protein
MRHHSHDPIHVGSFVNLVLGALLLASTLVFSDTPASRTSTVSVGALIVLLALAAMIWRPLAWVPAVAALWIFGAAVFLEHGSRLAPFVRSVIAFGVFAASLAPLAASPRAPQGRAAHRPG